MQRDRHSRRTYGGHRVARRPAFPGLLRSRRPLTPQSLPLARLIGQLLLILALILFGATFTATTLVYSTYADTAASLTPRLATLEERELFETSRIFDRNGQLLYEFFGAGRRTNITIDEISPLLISATVAIEDKSFFTNPGIDPSGIVRTLISSLQAGEETGGASTITQQVIKNSVLTEEERAPDRRYERKIKEIILAQELDQRYSKEQILELYLNENFYGNLAYGVEAASETYFGVRARDLNLSQAALLAGLPQLPSLYNPINHLERDAEGGYLPGVRLADGWLSPDYTLPTTVSAPRRRQVSVLRRMVEDGYISEAEARSVAAEPLRFAPQEVPLNAPHFVFYVRDLIQERYGQQILLGGGLRITTTIDLDLQQMVQEKAADRISELEARNIHNAAVVVMQPYTGQILSMVGSIDYNAIKRTTTPNEEGNVLDGQVNVSTRERQPGSALKPFTYLSAMEQGMSPETVIWDVPTDFPTSATGSGTWYTPLNYNGRFNGPVRIRTALANSLNIPAVKALKFAGVQQTLDLLDRAGIKQGLKRGKDFYGLALTLGGGEVTPLELTTAYNTLASGGNYYQPVSILQITDADGRVLEEFLPNQGQQVVDESLVAIITDMMSDDRARQAVWGLNSPLQLSLPAAVKTGTTNDWRDAWAVGYTPFVTVGVWTGNNNNEPTARVESLSGGGIIWRNVMEEIFLWIRDQPRYRELFAGPFTDAVIPTNFTLPDDTLLRRPICELPGSFGGYKAELFTRPMLLGIMRGTITGTVTLGLDPATDQRVAQFNIPCTAYEQVSLIRIPGEADWTPDGQLLPSTTLEMTATMTNTTEPLLEDKPLPEGNYCRPVEGVSYPPTLQHTVLIWKTPPSDPDMRVTYEWENHPLDSTPPIEELPPCSDELFLPPIPQPPVPGAILVPDLKGLGENQARDLLISLGVDPTMIYTDYQDRSRLGDEYDLYAAYVVLSSLPAQGDWILPGTTIVLGIRAPDTDIVPTLPPTEAPVPTPESSETPTPVPTPTP